MIGSLDTSGGCISRETFLAIAERMETHLEKSRAQQGQGRRKMPGEGSRSWMPIAGAQNHLDGAIKLMNQDKYYEANLALKAVEDSLTTDSVTLAEAIKK